LESKSFKAVEKDSQYWSYDGYVVQYL